jgi:hypothetical protein
MRRSWFVVLIVLSLAGCLDAEAGGDGMADSDLAEEPEAVPEPLVFQATVMVKCDHCYDFGPMLSLSAQTGRDGVDSAWIDFGSGQEGRPFRLTGTTDPDVYFHASCGSGGIEWFAEYGPEEGKVPDGATCAWVYEWEDLTGGTITLTIG